MLLKQDPLDSSSAQWVGELSALCNERASEMAEARRTVLLDIVNQLVDVWYCQGKVAKSVPCTRWGINFSRNSGSRGSTLAKYVDLAPDLAPGKSP